MINVYQIPDPMHTTRTSQISKWPSSQTAYIVYQFCKITQKLTCLVYTWNEVTFWWNEVAKGWNEVVWNEVTGFCEVIPRVRAPFFNAAAPILNQYLNGVLELCPNIFSWRHRGLSNPTVSPYLCDGVHLNSRGQYSLYRSYGGAILKAHRLL